MNQPVSRTTSCSPLSRAPPSGLELVRRHSAAGLRALAWTNTGAFSCSLGSEGRASRDSLRGIVVTPDSIPQFTIPRLAVQETIRAREKQGAAWGSTEELPTSSHPHSPSSSVSSSASSSSSPFGLSPAIGRKAHRSVSDPDTIKRTFLRRESSIPFPLLGGEHCHDPTTRAALSLPHLPKVTTPYGFITLSQSPQMANEEELFFQAGHHRWAKDQDKTPLRDPKLESHRNSSSRTLPIHVYANAPKKQPTGNNSWATVGCSGLSPSTATQTPTSRPKRSLWGVLRKHLSSTKDGST